MRYANYENRVRFYDIYKEVMQHNLAEHCWKRLYIHFPIAPALEAYPICWSEILYKNT